MSIKRNFLASLIILLSILHNLGLAEKTTVAIGSFEVIGEINDADYYRHGLPLAISDNLSKISDLHVVERSNLKRILDELNLSQTGIVDETTAQQVGNMLGAKIMLIGSVQKMEDNIRVMVRGVNVSTSRIDFSVEKTVAIRNSRDLFELEDVLTQKIMSNLIFIGKANPEFEFYTLYKDKQGKMQILPEGKMLSAGDEYALYIKPIDLCYLYVFQIDGKGKTYRLFPNKTYKTSENPIRPSERYWIPNTEKNFFLDESYGREHIYVFASPKRIPNFEGDSKVQIDLGDENLETMGPGGVTDKDNVIEVQAVIKRIQESGGVVHHIWFWHR
jgi:TolB-like protein